MNSLNIERLKYVSSSMQEIIVDLDEILSLYDSQSDVIKKHLEQSFRTGFLQYKELLGSYMSQCLKTLCVSVNGITYLKAIEVCIENKFLPDKELVLYKTLSKFRNDTAHVYKRPPFKILVEFYKTYRQFLLEIIEYINMQIKKDNE